MTSIVAVHGAVHGSWCWERVIPLLEADERVEAVVAVDLPGRFPGHGGKPIEEITLDDFVDHLVGEIERRDLHDVILVGHSLAGITLTPASHRLRDRLLRIVYLSTTNPPEGRSVLDAMTHPASPISRGVGPPDIFCTDFSAEDREWLTTRLGDEAPLVMAAPVRVVRPPSEIPASYILLERDEALPAEMQREHIATLGITDVVTMDAGHSPFVTHPEELAALLLGWA